MIKESYRHVIIYLWRGERHRFGLYSTFDKAATDLKYVRERGFVAWIEGV